MIILKTDGSTIDKVVQHAKHALHARLAISRGELILISQTEASLRPGQLPVRFSMEYVRYKAGAASESLKIWGRSWPYIIECTNSRRLKKPFRMSDISVSGKRYAQGGTLFKVDPEDERYLRENGYLEVIEEDALI